MSKYSCLKCPLFRRRLLRPTAEARLAADGYIVLFALKTAVEGKAICRLVGAANNIHPSHALIPPASTPILNAELLHQGGNVDIEHISAHDMGNRSLLAALTEEVFGKSRSLAGLGDGLKGGCLMGFSCARIHICTSC